VHGPRAQIACRVETLRLRTSGEVAGLYLERPGGVSVSYETGEDLQGVGDATPTPQNMTVVLNWTEELKRLVPTK